MSFIGILIGGIGGYGYSISVTSPQIQSLHAQITALQVNIQNLNQSYERLDDQYDSLLADQDLLTTSYNQLSSQYDSLLADQDLLTTSYNQLSSQYDSLLADQDLLTTSYNLLNHEYETLTDEYNQLSDQYNGLGSSYQELLDAYELAVAALPLSPTPISPETIDMDYSWYYQGRRYTLSLSIPESYYQYYQEMDRIPTADYSVYVTHPYDDEYINSMIRKFNFIALERGYSEEEKINLVISFVQSLPYTSDSVTTPYDEYPRYPLETLVDNGGDCEDTSILVASLLISMNYDVILIAPPGHMAIGVYIDTYGSYWEYDGKEYFFLETTSVGWEIGEIPQDYEGSSAYLYELKPIPICTQTWIAEWKGSRLEVIVTVSNVGTALADDILVYASFDAGEGYVWNKKTSNTFDLNVGNSVEITILLDSPINKHTRLIVGISESEGYSIDESYSQWFDT